jgi:hypothetical protein
MRQREYIYFPPAGSADLQSDGQAAMKLWDGRPNSIPLTGWDGSRGGAAQVFQHSAISSVSRLKLTLVLAIC